MILFKKATDLNKWLDAQRKDSTIVGFVPTMGALHLGHLSLIDTAKKNNQLVVCSIFVNPTQFNNPEDFEKYPITIEKDITLLEEAGCDILFLPSVQEIYPGNLFKKKHYELGILETILDGKYRPGHFQGVCMVVHRLLDIVNPHNLYLGQKDYQQCMVISKLIEIIGKPEINITICSTLREVDGLAMSSRNMRLNEAERAAANTIYLSLQYIKSNLVKGDLSFIKTRAEEMLKQAGFKTDYIEIADAGNLTLLEAWDGQQKIVALIAAFLNEVRLIDNMVLN